MPPEERFNSPCKYLLLPFLQEFPKHGFFTGEITFFDGDHYVAYYSADEDDEELSEYEFDDFEILSPPRMKRGRLFLGGAADTVKRRKRK